MSLFLSNGVNEQVVNFDEEIVMDFQASYNVNKNLGLLLQVNNLTDEPTQSYFGSTAYSGTTQYFWSPSIFWRELFVLITNKSNKN